MTHDEAFLEAIREQPDDDAPRLIYADWLEEHGQADRAEFIRVQCEKARLAYGSPRWFDLSIRENELRVAHEREWLGSCHEMLHRWYFRRGFPDEILVSTQQFLDRADELFRLGPIRKISLVNARRLIHSLAASSSLNRVTSLSLAAEGLGSEEVQVLCASPHLTRLVELRLSENRFDSEACGILRNSPFFARLRSLDLSGNSSIGATGVEYLVGTGEPAHLTDLNLGWCRLGSAGLQALTSARAFYRGLTHLDVTRNEVSEAGMRALAQAGGNLQYLCIGWNEIGNDGIQALVGSAAFSSLAVLNLGESGLGSKGAALLAQSPHLGNLSQLYLYKNHIGTNGAKALASSPTLRRLTVLSLEANEIGDEGAKALANSPHLANLRALFLGANGLRAWGVRDLVLSPHLDNLNTVDLHGNRLRDEGAQVIARWSRLAQLTSLVLRNNRIGDLGVKELAASPHLPCLRDLDLSNNDISADGAAALKGSGLRERLACLKLGKPESNEVVGLLPPSNS